MGATTAGPGPGGTGAPPAISVRDLWMVFGEEAGRHLAAARQAGGGLETITERLQAGGLIPAVRGVSFDVSEGELFVIMGLSGSGKSTVVRCVSRLLEPSGGTVEIAGENILAAPSRRMIQLRRSKMGMVFQHFGLFPHMTVAENIAFPLKVQGVREAERRRRAVEVIGLVGLEGREDAYPRALSGGQRQRVGIARSLAVNPDIWFLDEPFSALDPLIRRQLQDEFLSLQAELKKSIVFITHDIAEALKLADRICIMRDGIAVQIGTPAEIVLNPADDYVAEFSRDIPRTRLMTVGAVREPLDGRTPDPKAPALAEDLTLEQALLRCLEAEQCGLMPVVDADGRQTGLCSAEALARGMGGGIGGGALPDPDEAPASDPAPADAAAK
ncbi:MAG: betaine/proline/choline family ABC transporter ATP-binding protein [Pseudomonadota bacterium]